MNKILLLFVLLFINQHIISQASSYVPTDGLVGYYPFNGNANDESGNGNNGVTNNAVLTDDRFGNSNSAYLFSESAQSMITINPSTSLNITDDISFSAWFYPNDTSVGYIIDRDQCGISNDWGLQWSGGQVKMRTQNNENEIVSGPLEINNWYHIIVTRESGVFSMYINSQITSQGNNFDYNFTNTNMPIRIGDQSCTDPQPSFDGIIDDIGIWNRALNSDEIESIYLSTSVCETPTPTGDTQQTFCDTATVADLTATGDSIQWYDAATAGNVLDSTTALTDGQIVYASQTINSCESTGRLEVTVSIQDITITASATEVCAGESVDLTVSSGLTAGTTACTSADLPANLQTGLVGYWPFCGNANDESGNGNNGTVNGATLTTDRFGNIDSAYSFDGLEDHIINSADFLPTSERTVSVWFYTENISVGDNEGRSILGYGGNSCPLGQAWCMTIDNLGNSPSSQNSYEINSHCNYSTASYSYGSDVPNGNWHNWTTSTTNTGTKIYIDGVLSSNTDTYFDNTVVLGKDFIIGSLVNPNGTGFYDDNNNNPWNGKLDDVAIWNRALTSSEIQQLANSSTYTWSTGDTTENITVTPSETTEYWVDVTTNGVTCREYVTINTTAPAAPTGDTEQTFCDAVTVADLTVTGDNVQWYDSATGGNLLDSTTALTDGQIVYASQTINSCESTGRLEVTVSIQDITITASATEVCAGESVDLTVSSGLTAGTTACTSADLPANLQTGLVGYWPFCGNANDESGNGNNGTVNGATLTTDQFGNSNSAYLFSESGQSMITINPSASLNITDDISFSAWFYPNDTSVGYIIDRDECGFSNDWGLQWIGGQVKMRTQNNEDEIVSGPLEINNWYHIIVTRESGVFSMYINSQITSQGNNFDYNFTNTNQPIRFGDQSCTDPQPNFDGIIDDIGIWNRALTSSEILQLANSSTHTWSTGDTTENITVTPTETTEYWVDVIADGVTCREYITLEVNDLPDAPVSDGDISECETSADQILVASATVNTGEIITWYDAPSGGNIVTNPSNDAVGTQTYYAESTNETTGCVSATRTAVTLTIESAPDAPVGNAIQSFCDNVFVSDLMITGSNIQWYDAASEGDILNPTSALSDAQVLYASQTQNGCESINRLEVTVEINTIPNPILITNELEFCLAKEATLADLEVDDQGFVLEWYESFSGVNILPIDTLLEDGVSYYATLYDPISGCESLTRLEVVPSIVICEVVIYNAISLNDNGVNDYMVIENVEYFPDNGLEIYNRDGHLLYSQVQYGIGGNFFRGKANVSGVYNKNSNLPTGSYLYIFKYFNPYSQQQFTLKGFLTINSN